MSVIDANNLEENTAHPWPERLLIDDGLPPRSPAEPHISRAAVTLGRIAAVVSSVLAGVCLLAFAVATAGRTGPWTTAAAMLAFAVYSYIASLALHRLLWTRPRKP